MATKKSKPKHGYLLSGIPNNEEGNAFIAQFRKYCNFATYELSVRNNGPRRVHAVADGMRPRAYDQSLPRKYATHLRLYALPKDRHEKWREAWEAGKRSERALGDQAQRLEHLQLAYNLQTREALELGRKLSDATREIEVLRRQLSEKTSAPDAVKVTTDDARTITININVK